MNDRTDRPDRPLYEVVMRCVVSRRVRGPVTPRARHAAVKALRRVFAHHRSQDEPVFRVEMAEVVRVSPVDGGVQRGAA